MKKRRNGSKPAITFVIGALSGFFGFSICVLISSVWIAKGDPPAFFPLLSLILSVFIGAFISSFCSKKKMRQQGIVPVLIAFALYTVPVFLLILGANLFSVTLSILSLIPAAFAGAITGGFTAARLK